MRIVLDLQGVQTRTSGRRGIGRYSLSFAKAIARHASGHQILIALNGSYPESIELIRGAFDSLLPQENIRVWQVAGPAGGGDPANDTRRRAAELTREAFLTSLAPDIVHISSLFEGLNEDAITSVGAFTSKLPTAVTLYDLIPHLHRDIYLTDEVTKRWYEDKLDHLRRADLLLAISESSRCEALNALDFRADSVVNISSAAEDSFQVLRFDDGSDNAVRRKYGLTKPFVMYTGGIDRRKNIDRLIEAYAALPLELRQAHQLAIVCAVLPQEKSHLERFARRCGLADLEVVFTGFVPESDLVALYNLCKLFVFPSWHEGFGLPVLEAMRCGAPVIAANASSLPEVIERADALFDPYSCQSICATIQTVLTDEALRNDLAHYSRMQAKKFSWHDTAERAIGAFEKLQITRSLSRDLISNPSSQQRPTLAYVSPLPPERSGIAAYSAELLPELALYYQIVVIVQEEGISDPWINANCMVHTPAWLEGHAHEIDRVLYHFGNSEFHEHMFALLETVPGVVVLHDFFLSGAQAYREFHSLCPYAWTRELYRSHGYKAVGDRYLDTDVSRVILKYPANLSVLQCAQGVIVHSESSRRLAADWYGSGVSRNWRVIPLLRVAAARMEKQAARQQIGVPKDSFVVCSFGILGPTKLNHRLLSAWLASSLAHDTCCMLLFVGENDSGEYGKRLQEQIRASDAANRIHIIGWVTREVFQQYLVAADVGVQLRALSRGETSGAVLDCLNHGLATIVNANGSMADIPDDSVWKLPDEFAEWDLVAALEALAGNPKRRKGLGEQGRQLIKESHDPAYCAKNYYSAIESFWAKGRNELSGLLDALSNEEFVIQGEGDLGAISTMVASNLCSTAPKQFLIDISELMNHAERSGVQRAVEKILAKLVESPPSGYRVEPVFASEGVSGYFYARRFTSRFLGFEDSWAVDSPIDACAGDVFFGLSFSTDIVPAQKLYLSTLRDCGVQVCFAVYGLQPAIHPESFPPSTAAEFTRWLSTVVRFDKIVAVSNAVADEVERWLEQHGSERLRPLGIDWFHPGAEPQYIEGIFDESTSGGSLRKSKDIPSFLVVSTLESRVEIETILGAFECLWADGVDINLVVMGEGGWLGDGLPTRISKHSELGKHLFWERRVSDEISVQRYSSSDCLIAASAAESFGLPILEATARGLAIIARDVPALREAVGNHAFYFDTYDAGKLAESIRVWLSLYAEARHPLSEGIRWFSWAESVERLKRAVFNRESYISWMPGRESGEGREHERPVVSY